MRRLRNLTTVMGVNLLTFVLLSLAGCGGNGTDQTTTASLTDPNTAQATSENTSAAAGNPASDPLHPMVVLETSLGKVTLTLDAEKAPETVRNFLGYVNEGFYDQTIVHQVFRGNSVLAGGYDVNLVEKTPRAPIPNEAHNGLKNVRGTIAMTRFPDDVHSATCQFFLNVADNPSLDFRDQTLDGYGYCVFGRVTDGMDVVDQMAMSEVRELPDFDQMPAPTITIMSARQVP